MDSGTVCCEHSTVNWYSSTIFDRLLVLLAIKTPRSQIINIELFFLGPRRPPLKVAEDEVKVENFGNGVINRAYENDEYKTNL